MKKKVCKQCKVFVDGNQCHLCKGNSFANSWQGRLLIFDAQKSEIAKKLSITAKGEYAIKVR